VSNKSLIRDDRYFLTGDCGSIQFGSYFRKDQSGGDTPNDHSHENNYTLFYLATMNPPVRFRYFADQNYHENCEVPGFNFGLQTFDSNDVIRLTNKLASAVKGHSFNAAVSLAEGNKTLSMIGHRAGQLAGALSSLKRGNFNSFAKKLGVPSRNQPKVGKVSPSRLQDKWLEFEFGWRPLVNDIYEGSQAVFALTNRPLYRVYRSSINKKVDVFSTSGSTKVGTSEAILSYRVHVKEDYSPIASLGLLDPAEVLWELTPYSFVADWVVPVGNYLSARSFLSHLSSSVWSTYFSKVSLKSNFVSLAATPASGYRSLKRLDLTRQLASATLPRPTVKSFGQMAQWKHAADGFALLMQHRK